MKLTLVAEDKVVVKDGQEQHDLELQWLPSNVWALEWNDNKGHIEYKDGTVEPISELGIYQQAVDEWETAYTKSNTGVIPWEDIFKRTRNELLAESDWTQLTDNALTDAKKQEWAVYRQKLRDLPANTSDFENVNYPTPPN